MSAPKQVEYLQVCFYGNASDPRDDYTVAGCENFQQPFRLYFQTPMQCVGNLTTNVIPNDWFGEPEATLHWEGTTVLGKMQTSYRRCSMSDMVVVTSNTPSGTRLFTSVDDGDGSRKTYAWVKSSSGYNLYLYAREGQVKIGTYRFKVAGEPWCLPTECNGPIPFAVFSFIFAEQRLLIDALIALALNRWLDQGMTEI